MGITSHEALIITSALPSSLLQTANTVWWEFPCCTHGEDVLPSPGADNLPEHCSEFTDASLLAGTEAPPVHFTNCNLWHIQPTSGI